MEYTKEELIQLCLDSVVSSDKWNNRDSYAAQVNVQSIYAGLVSDVNYRYEIENDTIWVILQQICKKSFSRCY